MKALGDHSTSSVLSTMYFDVSNKHGDMKTVMTAGVLGDNKSIVDIIGDLHLMRPIGTPILKDSSFSKINAHHFPGQAGLSSWNSVGLIDFVATEDYSSNGLGTKMAFHTTPDGALNPQTTAEFQGDQITLPGGGTLATTNSGDLTLAPDGLTRTTSDIYIEDMSSGIIMKDDVTGQCYRLKMSNGNLVYNATSCP
jgi:hypothetical protein